MVFQLGNLRDIYTSFDMAQLTSTVNDVTGTVNDITGTVEIVTVANK